MRWVAILHDAPGMAALRNTKGIQDHIAYLRQNAREVLIAGPLRETPGGPIVGGLWVMEVETRERAVELVENDPYFGAGYRTYRLLNWSKALENVAATL